MKLQVNEIEQHDNIVRKKYPTAKMVKSGDSRLNWFDDYGKVATLIKKGNTPMFKFYDGR